jgi:Zn-dependent protease with chaperone function
MISVLTSIAMLAYMMVVMIPIDWYLEVRADRIAARFVGKEHIKSALLVLSRSSDPEEPSEDHPPITGRLKLIEKLQA